MKRFSLLVSTSVVAFALVLTLPVSVYASTGPVTTTTYTLVGSLHESALNGLPSVVANYANSAGSNITLGVVYAVVHNSFGQSVLFTTATLTPAAGQNATVYLIIAGLASGTYSATVFAVDSDNVAISVSSNVQVTV